MWLSRISRIKTLCSSPVMRWRDCAFVSEDELSCSMLRQLGRDVAKLPVDMVVSMEEEEFQDCLEVLGKATDWSDQQIHTLLRRAIQVQHHADC